MQGGHRPRRHRQPVHPGQAGRPAVASACARSTPRSRRASRSTRRTASTTASAARSPATPSRSCGRSSTSTSSAPSSGWPAEGRRHAALHRRRTRARRPAEAQAAPRRHGEGGRLVPRPAADGARRRRRPRATCAAAASTATSCARYRLGWAPAAWDELVQGAEAARRRARRAPASASGTAAAAPPTRSAAACCSRSSTPTGTRRRLRRADPPRRRRPEVQELAGDRRSTQEPGALRPQLAQGRDRQRRRGRRGRSCARATPT